MVKYSLSLYENIGNSGNHISALLLRMFVMYFPQMIEAGMVYKAIPPLYAIKEGKKNKYFTENIDMVKYIQNTFTQKYELSTIDNVKLAPKELTVFFMQNADYNYYLSAVSSTYAIDPYIMELVLYHFVQNGDKFVFDKLKKEVNKAYRFMDVKKVNNTIVVQGTIDAKYTLFVSDKLIYDCRYVIDILKKNTRLYYNIDKKQSTIHTVMSLYDKSTPSNVQRYKGLGEMDDNELAESTLLPTGNRTLVRYTLSGAKEEIETIRQYESNPKMILDLVGNVSREDLLD